MGSNRPDNIHLSNSDQILPQQEMLEVHKHQKSVSIGIPREVEFQENRVAIVPQAAGLLVANGHKVLIESKAGKNAHFKDEEYNEAGAKICYSSEEIYKSDIILKVAPPTAPEVSKMKMGQCLFLLLTLPTENQIITSS